MQAIETTTEALIESRLKRRSMMSRVTAGALAAGALAVGGVAATSTPAQAQAPTDADILNFALNLEYLEAEFYLRAFFGASGGLAGNDIGGIGVTGGVSGGSQVQFVNKAIQSYAQRLAADELTHVRFLRRALGNAAVARPAINLDTSFTGLAVAAGLIAPGQTFNPFENDVTFLLGAFVFEDVGVTAYAGAARFIQNRDFLDAAASILAVEAYHAGSIRTLLANIGGGVAANAISNVRASVGGGKEQGILVENNNYNAVATDGDSLAFRRTTTEVLNIVYAGGAGANFGFFPARVNGNIR